MFDFSNISQDPQAMSQVIGAIIGVVGLIIGTVISIITSFMVRHMDIKREERRDRSEMDRLQKEKEFNLKQEVYSQFISELATLENFLTKKSSDSSLKNLENFDNEWTRIEIRVDLVGNPRVKELKDNLTQELMTLAKEKFAGSGKEVAISESYTADRTALLEAIRSDMEITTKK